MYIIKKKITSLFGGGIYTNSSRRPGLNIAESILSGWLVAFI